MQHLSTAVSVIKGRFPFNARSVRNVIYASIQRNVRRRLRPKIEAGEVLGMRRVAAGLLPAPK